MISITGQKNCFARRALVYLVFLIRINDFCWRSNDLIENSILFSSSYHLVLQHAKLPTNTTVGLSRSWKMIGTLPGAVSVFFHPYIFFIQRFFTQKRFLHILFTNKHFNQRLHPETFLAHFFTRILSPRNSSSTYFSQIYFSHPLLDEGLVPPFYRTKTGAPIPFLSRTSLKWKCTSIKQENYLKKQIFTATNLLQTHF